MRSPFTAKADTDCIRIREESEAAKAGQQIPHHNRTDAERPVRAANHSDRSRMQQAIEITNRHVAISSRLPRRVR
jgi:hypothetical protein